MDSFISVGLREKKKKKLKMIVSCKYTNVKFLVKDKKDDKEFQSRPTHAMPSTKGANRILDKA